MFPSPQLLEQVNQQTKTVPNRRKESKRKVHYCLFLLGYKSGLRISEAINFNLAERTEKGLYRIKSKGQKERLVYIPKEVIQVLEANKWKPNQTNRFNFYHFLKKIKRELGISQKIELTPHTLRRAFTTYHAENGLPLPLLQKLLGHSSIRTTALYWQNIYQEPDNDTADILAGKKWLENRNPPELPTENFPETVPKSPEPPFIKEKPIITEPKPIPHITVKTEPVNYQPEPIKPTVNNIKNSLLISEQSNSKKDQIITELSQKLSNCEQIIANLQKDLHSKENQLNHITETIKKAAKQFYYLQKTNYYKQLEKERQELEAKIIQLPPKKLKN
jgi:hypothetical protein